MGEKSKVVVNHLCKNFGQLEVLKDCNFQIENGEFVCIVGPTGCGKTTFLNVLTCIEKVSSGEILIDGIPADPRKHNLSFVFQEPSAFPWLTVEENVRFGLETKKYPRTFIEEQTQKVMKMMGLVDSRNTYPEQLAASAAQKVVIARAFAMNPDLLLMDEPYAQMDIKARFMLEDEVIRLWKELKSTVLFITHNIEEAVYLADRILIMSQKPTYIKEEVIIDMPRPRDVSSEKFIQYRSYITDQIKWW